jgi:ABC-type lipopolysaccharide export system ATPase subunit
MALEKQLLFYMIVIGQPNSGNIYLDDLNITDYPMYRAQQESDIWHKNFKKTKYRRQYLECSTNFLKAGHKMESLLEFKTISVQIRRFTWRRTSSY